MKPQRSGWKSGAASRMLDTFEWKPDLLRFRCIMFEILKGGVRILKGSEENLGFVVLLLARHKSNKLSILIIQYH
jgi:hypothetical protein